MPAGPLAPKTPLVAGAIASVFGQCLAINSGTAGSKEPPLTVRRPANGRLRMAADIVRFPLTILDRSISYSALVIYQLW